LLGKYNNIIFHDPNNKTTYRVHPKILEFRRKNRTKGIDGGWALIVQDGEDDCEEFEIGEMTIELITNTAQVPGVEIMGREAYDGFGYGVHSA
jgi:hypothetical protein